MGESGYKYGLSPNMSHIDPIAHSMKVPYTAAAINKKNQGVNLLISIKSTLATLNNKPERFITMCWEDQVKGEFLADLQVQVNNQRGVLAQLASTIANADANIDNISVDPGDGRYNIVNLTVTVRDGNHLRRLMRRISALAPVMNINRRIRS